MGKRSSFQRRPQDAYNTIDPRAVAALAPHLERIETYAEPCAGEGWLVYWLTKLELFALLVNDIRHGGVDALTIRDWQGADAIITNPPWSRPLLHAMILHFQYHLPTWLLFDSDWAFTQQARPYLWHCSDIVAVGKLRWMPDTEHDSKDNCSWYRFDARHNDGPRFHGQL